METKNIPKTLNLSGFLGCFGLEARIRCSNFVLPQTSWRFHFFNVQTILGEMIQFDLRILFQMGGEKAPTSKGLKVTFEICGFLPRDPQKSVQVQRCFTRCFSVPSNRKDEGMMCIFFADMI